MPEGEQVWTLLVSALDTVTLDELLQTIQKHAKAIADYSGKEAATRIAHAIAGAERWLGSANHL